MTLSSAIVIGLTILAILVLTAGRTIAIMRAEKGARRGSPPGTGHHVIDADYFSGGGGGGHQGSFKVPRDPDEYARRFVPKDRPGRTRPIRER